MKNSEQIEREQSLTLAPYWLDGHAIAAQAAEKLGYRAVADAIRDELRAFLDRLPVLQRLSFSDMSPFISDATLNWLHPPAVTAVNNGAAQETDWKPRSTPRSNISNN